MEALKAMIYRVPQSGYRRERRGFRFLALSLSFFVAVLFAMIASASAQMANPNGSSPTNLKTPVAARNQGQHGSRRLHGAAHAKPAPQAASRSAAPVNVVKPAPPNLTSKPAVTPSVEFTSGQLSIDAPNSELADVFRAVQRALGATVEGGRVGERVVVRLGPGSPTEVLTALLDGSRYDYILVGKAEQPGVISRILLTPRPSEESSTPSTGSAQPAARPAPQAEENADETTEPEPGQSEEQQSPPPMPPQLDQNNFPPNPRMQQMQQPQQPPEMPPDNQQPQ